MISDNEQPRLQVTLYIFLTLLFKGRRIASLKQGRDLPQLKLFNHVSRTEAGVRAKTYRSPASVLVSHPRLLCALLIREHPVDVFSSLQSFQPFRITLIIAMRMLRFS